jgi:hypothetical protein
MARMRKARASA